MSIRFCGAFASRHEPESFHVRLENGEECWLLVHFYDPMLITLDGRTVATEKDCCLIIPPGQPQDYRSAQGGFTNDYVKFILSPDDTILTDHQLPVGQIFYISPSPALRENIDRICWSLTDNLRDHQREMEGYFEAVLKVLRDERVVLSPKSLRDDISLKRLRKIREDMRAEPSQWTVEKMAAAFYMTRSHFSVLYKKHFGISPGADLKEAVMAQAEELLASTGLSVEEIAIRCGYGSSENFIRSFKRTHGITPLKYRHSRK